MILLILLLAPVPLAAATENSTGDPVVVIDANGKLVSITAPSIDLDLSGFGIHSLDSAAFANCTSVKTLDLSDNSIKNLPKDVFSPLTNLESLSLARNDLDGKAMERAFLRLANLKSLDITHNPLSRILENESFVGLTNSCEIYVEATRNFRTITPHAFGKIKKSEPKNRTIAVEVKNCPDRLDDRIEMLEAEHMFDFDQSLNINLRNLDDQPYSGDDVQMCMTGTTVRFVDFSNVTDTLSSNCFALFILNNRTKLIIYDNSITSFETGWFRLRNTSLNAIYVTIYRSYENLTGDLLNDLPENIRFFSITECNLKRLSKGVIVNEHLRGLDLSSNMIEFIEENTFAGLNLTRLKLADNPLTSLDYVPTLPETLLWLNIEYSWIREIPVGSFSHLRNLLVLELGDNNFYELVPGSFRGLVSLQWLDMSSNWKRNVRNLRPNCFQDLSRLYRLSLADNDISRLEKGAFNDLGCLAELFLRANDVSRIDEGAFDGLTDSLKMMDLNGNKLETLQAGTFVGVPKFNLTLRHNNIRKIEKGAFDLPYLNNLDLSVNGLTTIEKGAVKNVGTMADETEINLGFNGISRLENGALGGLPSNAYVSLAANPVEVIQAGVFDDS